MKKQLKGPVYTHKTEVLSGAAFRHALVVNCAQVANWRMWIKPAPIHKKPTPSQTVAEVLGVNL